MERVLKTDPSLKPANFNICNDIKPIHNIRGLERMKLDFDSPRMKKALDNLSV